MIAAEPTRLTSVGDSSASRPGSMNWSRMKNANASPTSDASPRSRATSPTTTANASARTMIGVSRS